MPSTGDGTRSVPATFTATSAAALQCVDTAGAASASRQSSLVDCVRSSPAAFNRKPGCQASRWLPLLKQRSAAVHGISELSRRPRAFLKTTRRAAG